MSGQGRRQTGVEMLLPGVDMLLPGVEMLLPGVEMPTLMGDLGRRQTEGPVVYNDGFPGLEMLLTGAEMLQPGVEMLAGALQALAGASLLLFPQPGGPEGAPQVWCP